MKSWSPEQNNELKKMYVITNITSDSLIKDSDLMQKFTNNLNENLQAFFSAQDVASQLLRLRKKGNLPKLRK